MNGLYSFHWFCCKNINGNSSCGSTSIFISTMIKNIDCIFVVGFTKNICWLHCSFHSYRSESISSRIENNGKASSRLPRCGVTKTSSTSVT